MIHERELRKEIASLLRGEVSLAAFERWVGSRSWNMFNEDSPSVIDLIAAVNLLVSELHDRHIDEKSFRSELRTLLSNVVITFDGAPVRRKHAAMSLPQWIGLALPSAAKRPVLLSVMARSNVVVVIPPVVAPPISA